MSTKKTTSQREKELLDKIEKAKADLVKLQKKQKLEIGALAYKYGLNEYGIEKLEPAFKQLSEELASGNAW